MSERTANVCLIFISGILCGVGLMLVGYAVSDWRGWVVVLLSAGMGIAAIKQPVIDKH